MVRKAKKTEDGEKKKKKREPKMYLSQVLPLHDLNSWHKSGILALDMAIGAGIPKGSVLEIAGPTESRKSTMACIILASIQKNPNNNVCWYSSEDGLPEMVALNAGMDLTRLEYERTDTIERLFNLAGRYCRSEHEEGRSPVWVVDSLSGCSCQEELFAPADKTFMYPPHARRIKIGWRQHFPTVSKTHALAIAINHITDEGHIPGGKYTGYISAVRTRLEFQNEILDEDGKVIGFESHIHTLPKRLGSKTVVPFRFYYQEHQVPVTDLKGAEQKDSKGEVIHETIPVGIDYEFDLFSALHSQGIITQAGSFYRVRGIEKAFYRKAFRAVIKDQGPEFWESLILQHYTEKLKHFYDVRGLTPEEHLKLCEEHQKAEQYSLDGEMEELMEGGPLDESSAS